MSKLLKNVFLSVGIFAFTLVLVGAFSTNKAYALECTMDTGTWNGTAGGVNDGATNGTATFTGCTGDLTPAVGDTLLVPTGVVLTISGSATVAGTTLADPVAGSNGITVSGGTFTSGPLVFTGSSGAGDSTVAVGANALSATTIAIAAGAGAGDSILSTTSGSVTTTGAVTITGTATGVARLTTATGTLTAATTVTLAGHATNAQLTSTGASTIDIGTNLVNTLGDIDLTGTVGIGGILTFTAGTIDINAGTTTVTGTTTIADAKTLTIASGATATLAAVTGTLTGAITNAGTLSTAALTLGAGGALTNSGTSTSSGTITLGAAATVTNSGTMTAAGTFGTGAGVVVNTGTLNLAGAAANALNVATLTANTAGTINYNLAGAQTVFAGAHYNLTLSGTGVKTIPAAATVVHDVVISSTLSASPVVLTNGLDITVAGLKVYGSWKALGSWGSAHVDTNATHENSTYFAAANTGKITVTTTHSSSVSTSSDNDNTTSSSGNNNDDDEDADEPEVTTNVIAGCGARTTGFSSSTGVSCVGNTGTATTTPAGTVIPGCGNRTTGFSSSSGASCAGNSVTSLTVIPGCGNRNTGFSSSTGASCVGNTVGASSANSYNFGSAVLRNGSQGEAVMELQRFLNAKLNLGLVIDGKLGPKTIAVIKTWQAANALVADGLVGPATKAKMNASVQ